MGATYLHIYSLSRFSFLTEKEMKNKKIVERKLRKVAEYPMSQKSWGNEKHSKKGVDKR